MRTLSMALALLALPASSCALGCQSLDAKTQPPFEILVHVESDPGRPLAGAVLVVNGRERGTTLGDGRARLSFVGNDGDTFDLWVRCPDGFASPSKPIPASLRRIADPAKLPQYDATCAPSQRSIVVAIRADNGANLPVMYLNKEVARTDASGAAHFFLPAKPGDSFELVLNTSERGNEKLRPQNPSAPFVVRSADEVFLFEQRFNRDKDPVRYVAPPKKATHLFWWIGGSEVTRDQRLKSLLCLLKPCGFPQAGAWGPFRDRCAVGAAHPRGEGEGRGERGEGRGRGPRGSGGQGARGRQWIGGGCGGVGKIREGGSPNVGLRGIGVRIESAQYAWGPPNLPGTKDVVIAASSLGRVQPERN